MALTLRQIRNNTAAARGLMRRARAERFAVGAFNLDNQETLKAIARAAVVKKSPVIVEVTHDEIRSLGIDNVRDMVDNYKSELGIEIYLGLDHGPSVESAIESIEAGFELIHIDISRADSNASDEDIVAGTKLVADCARLTGALVESEPRYFDGVPQDAHGKPDHNKFREGFSSPNSAKEFVEATSIDIYAAAVGNLHGKHAAPKMLDLELLRQIRESIDCHISIHGGGGTPGHYFQDAIKLGVNKINISSDMRLAFRDSLERALRENPDELAVFKLMDEVIGSVQRVVEEKMDMFGSVGKSKA
jgi:fructose-bisphosphate aldolase class II